MKRTHEVPLVAGMTVGLAIGLGGVALGTLLGRKEGQAMCRLVQRAHQASDAGRHRESSSLHMRHLAQRARQTGEQVARLAGEQYLPKAKEALSGALAYSRLNAKHAGSAD